ncbi:aminoglycoside phosphotransferase family protein [Jannaschia formosa]|uniref:aminoglycoside phosphotransferase family protein n=1 Tax=Jannaschia formosa TaxID=2259592 RepID=UPI000E1BA24B|nr:phosphotransferase [Jannaschia formosa]TFL20146.1 aminoglycoside phosphotransferase [Jannaschia formosa]
MKDRSGAIETFLALAGWQDATRVPLAGDASRRSYVRLLREPERAILMDAPPDAEQDVRPFLAVAAELAARGLSVPGILARDTRRGLLLLEDLGDDTYARATAADPGSEPLLYATAAEALAEMQATPPPDLPRYTDRMPELAALAIDWYAPEAAPHRDALKAAMAEALAHPAVTSDTLVHRDYHADNLLWLPRRAGVARVGMLDFQDAMRGPRDYDLASLIHDPRRAVSPEARQAALGAWQAATGRDPDEIAAGIAICSAQRCLRILGVFARLCLRDGKTRYPDFIPATWAALLSDLAHPALSGLREVARALPPPSPDRLDAIRARAGAMAGRERADP